MGSLPVHGFGKLPIHGDFVRVNRTVPVLATLDHWFQEGIHRMRLQAGREFEARFDATLPMRLLVSNPGGKDLFAGAWIASQDRTGRRFPFVLGVCAALPGSHGLANLPCELAACLELAEDQATQGWRGRSLAEFQELAAAMPCQQSADGAFAEYASERLWDAVLPGSDPAARAGLLWRIRQLLQPQPPKLVLRLPTTGEGEQIGFWLQLVARWAVGSLPSLAAWRAANGPQPGALALLFDRLNGRYFEPVFWPEVENDHAYDLARDDSSAASMTTRLPDGHAEKVAAAATLAELLAI